MQPIDLILLLLALLGHCALWVGILNRIHSVGIKRKKVNWVTIFGLAILPLTPIVVCVVMFVGRMNWAVSRLPAKGPWWPLVYLVPCWGVGLAVSLRWLARKLRGQRPNLLLENHSRDVDVSARLGYRPVRGFVGRSLGWIPGEQSLTLRVQEKTIELPRLPESLDGLRILHLSDFHFTGRIQPAYFEEVVRSALETPADLIALTGDFVDNTECIDWLASTVGRLQARLGVYFVLGNHDRKVVDVPRLRKTLVECGFVDLGGRWQQLEVAGQAVVLAGNELPWLGPEPDLSNCPGNAGKDWVPRILLAHTPDQWPWAVSNDFDLMLAGHTHGGQVCVPLVGPIFCPSKHGVEMASGVFYKLPTVVHVTRGVSGEFPLRWNCPPEAATLILRASRPS
ncbi:MAG TPA: metallophosphoesterase [Pirellulales bacterium]|jgi:hypothetical protein|nr:metallophosphoesterase [Pirellulales bacterium]